MQSTPVNNQEPGNWKLDRAGWCPGMVVPVRFDNIQKSLFGSDFNFTYKFEEWTRNNVQNNNTFYAISTFVITKSNTLINKAVITD